ncbi:MAG: hypothetical protein WKG06_07910 [Segetibacter sp.]
MKILLKYIWREVFDYYANRSVDDLRLEIQQLFNRQGANFSINLTGKFISEYEFEMTPKWQFIMIRNYENEIAYLKGRIFQDKEQKTRATFTVRPNSIFLIFFFIFPIIGILVLSKSGQNYKDTLAAYLFIIAVPLIVLAFGYFAKQGIKNRFIATFNLRPYNEV